MLAWSTTAVWHADTASENGSNLPSYVLVVVLTDTFEARQLTITCRHADCCACCV